MSAEDCPNCGAATPDGARRCLSCYADLTAEGADSRWASGSESDAGRPDDGDGACVTGAFGTGDGAADDDPDAGGVDGVVADAAPGPTGEGDAVDDAGEDSPRAGWEGRPATVGVAVVGGGLVGAVALVSLLLGLAHWSALPLAVLAWLATTVHLLRRDRTRRAVAHACYAVAVASLTLPLFWFGPAPEGGSFGGRVLLAVVSFVAVGLVAGPLVGVGYWVGRG